MRKLILLAACALMTAFLAGNAAADDLRGKVAVTAKLGVTNPANSEKPSPLGTLVVDTDAGVIGGGGILFGVDDNIAMEIDVTRSSFHTSGFGTAGVTNVSVGGQYRFPERQRLIPYVGAGVDVLISDLNDATYTKTVVGMHLAGGLDLMVQRHLALNAEVKGVEAFTTDVRAFNGAKLGEFDPSSLSFTVGVRLFFN